MNFANINWFAILACVVAGQVFLTIWFVALFGTPWARAYGVSDKAQHTKEIPGYTYAIGAACVLLLSLGITGLQSALRVESLTSALSLGLQVALCFCVATALPGYAFLKRWSAFVLAIGSQVSLILIISAIVALWP